MYTPANVKNPLEALHLDYLCATFPLQRGSDVPDLALNGLKPDLFSIATSAHATPRALFELKSRNYARDQPGPRKRYASDHAWWDLWHDQITGYEQLRDQHELALFWIFLLSQTSVPVTHLERITERSILARDIYIVPWDVYRLVQPTPSGRRYLGLNRLQHTCSFTSSHSKKTHLHVALSIPKESRYIFEQKYKIAED